MTIPTTSIEGIGLGPVADTAALPPFDGLLAQNVQDTADFKSAAEQFQLAMEALPSSVTEAPDAETPVAAVPEAEVPAAGAPHVDRTALPPLDRLLAQNVQATADFKIAAERFRFAMEALPVQEAEVPVTDVPVAKVPVTKVPVADVPVTKVPVTEAPVTKVPVAEVPVAEVAPHVDAAALPPLDRLLAQNAQVTADFKAAAERFQLAMEALPASVAEAPVANVPVAAAPVANVPVAAAPVANVPVAEAPVAKVSTEGVPHVDVAALPPMDDLLSQNERLVADFEATAEKLQLAMKGLPLPKVTVTEPDELDDGADVAAPQALPVVEIALPVRTERVEAADGAGAARGIEGVRSVDAVGSKDLIVIAEAVADRILVSPGLMQGDGEVRVLLKPDVLQGTEIRVVAENGTVNVNFIPATPEVAVLLERNQPMLVQHLATHVPSVRLGVSVGRSVRNREDV